MSTTRDDLENFHQFAVERLTNGQKSLDDLFAEWCDSRSRNEINAAIRSGLADVEAGRYGPAAQAMESIRQFNPIR